MNRQDEKEKREKKKERYSIKYRKGKNEKEQKEVKERKISQKEEQRMNSNELLKNLKTVKSIISDQFNINCIEFEGSNDLIESDIHSIKRVPFQKGIFEKHFNINK